MTREFDAQGRIQCSMCKRSIADDEVVSDFDGPNYGFGPLVVCDPCMDKAEPGSWLAEKRERRGEDTIEAAVQRAIDRPDAPARNDNDGPLEDNEEPLK